MRVLDEGGKSIAAGDRLDLAELGLPLAAGQAALLIFWKRQ